MGTAGRRRGGSVDPDVQAIYNAFTTPPADDIKAFISDTVLALKTAGLWPIIDVLVVTAAADSQAQTINWKSPGTYNLTLVNSPSFASFKGFSPDGTTSYGDTGFNPNTAVGANFTMESGTIAVRVDTGQAGNNSVIEMGNGNPGSVLQFRNGGNRGTGRINNNTVILTDTSFVSSGFMVVTRSAVATSRLYRALLGVANDNTNPSTSLGQGNFMVGGNIVGGVPTPSSTKRVNCYMIGGGFTSQNNTDFQNIMNAYMTAVGVV